MEIKRKLAAPLSVELNSVDTAAMLRALSAVLKPVESAQKAEEYILSAALSNYVALLLGENWRVGLTDLSSGERMFLSERFKLLQEQFEDEKLTDKKGSSDAMREVAATKEMLPRNPHMLGR